MGSRINLYKEMFTRDTKNIVCSEAFSVDIFKYESGVEAVKISNAKGYVVLLPFMGQMIWDMEFLGHNMVMKSIYSQPEPCEHTYGESYGCFLMHCGLTAMGNPSSADNHLPHGELPIAKYREVYLTLGEDEKGKYISLGGVYRHKRAFELNYEFTPECRLYEGRSTIDILVNIKNNKDLPLEYFYLCHINYRPVDGAELIYTAKHENIVAHHEVPSGHPAANKTKAYLARLDADMSVMDKVDRESQSYAPEIVFTCRYDTDENGEAHTLQKLPDGYACYVCHRPEELPFGIRWIARTDDEDAMGMVLPATAEHKGYTYCKERGQERYVSSGESVTFHITTGILSPADSQSIITKIAK